MLRNRLPKPKSGLHLKRNNSQRLLENLDIPFFLGFRPAKFPIMLYSQIEWNRKLESISCSKSEMRIPLESDHLASYVVGSLYNPLARLLDNLWHEPNSQTRLLSSVHLSSARENSLHIHFSNAFSVRRKVCQFTIMLPNPEST